MRCLAALFISITSTAALVEDRACEDFPLVLLRKTVIVNIVSSCATKREFDWTKCAFGALLVDVFHWRRCGLAMRGNTGKRCMRDRKSEDR